MDYLASEDQKRAEFVRTRIKANLDKIGELAKAEFEGNYFWVEDEDGEATVRVDDMVLTEGPEIIAIDADFGTVQLVFDAHYTAYLEYRDSATSVYDKETDQLIFSEQREEEVQRDVKLTVEADISFDEVNPEEVTIESVNIVSPAKGFGIETSRAADSPYK